VAAIALVLGILPLLFLPELPSTSWMLAISAIALGLWRKKERWFCQVAVWLLLGFVFAIFSATVLRQQITSLGGKTKEVVATIQTVRF
jgi:competence protein ComEC